MSAMKVMRFNWLTEDDDVFFWELISNARDDVQFVIFDRSNQNVIFKLGIEPTTLVKRNLPGNIHVTERDVPAKRVAMVTQTEGEDSASVSASLSSDDDWELFLQQNCSFSPIVVKLSTTSYGERSSTAESESDQDTVRQEVISSFVKTNFENQNLSEFSPRYVTRCIYESGEFCTFQYYYILETNQFDYSDCLHLSPSNFQIDHQNKEEVFDKLCHEKLYVRINTQEIAEFCRNLGGLLVSPNLILCLQHLLRSNREKDLSRTNLNCL